MKRTSLLLADDHPVVIEALARQLQQHFEIVGLAHDGREMISMAKQLRPDVVVADIAMPHISGIDAALMLRKEIQSIRLLFLTMHADIQLLEKAFRAGACGYVLKDCRFEDLVKAIEVVAAGQRYVTSLLSDMVLSKIKTPGALQTDEDAVLTLRQREVLQSLSEGRTTKEIAALLNISTRTAESHKYKIMQRLGVQNTAALIRHTLHCKPA